MVSSPEKMFFDKNSSPGGGPMSLPRDEARSEIQVSDAVTGALEEFEEERALLEQQRASLRDQRMLLDLERKELEQQMQTLQLQDALLDQLSARLDQQEAQLASEAEGMRLTGKRSSPRQSNR
jgi:peptidoglycan hydrolase CwlO-like protein